MELQEIIEIVQGGKEFKPQVQEIVEILLSYSKEIKQVMDALMDGIVNLKIRSIEKFEKAGYSRKEAILLSCDTFQNIQSQLNKRGK